MTRTPIHPQEQLDALTEAIAHIDHVLDVLERAERYERDDGLRYHLHLARIVAAADAQLLESRIKGDRRFDRLVAAAIAHARATEVHHAAHV